MKRRYRYLTQYTERNGYPVTVYTTLPLTSPRHVNRGTTKPWDDGTLLRVHSTDLHLSLSTEQELGCRIGVRLVSTYSLGLTLVDSTGV